ncbi:MAG: acetoin utilization protein, partial [SAR116 cluster bacterium]|nr:acetoin utilization protein [SAR116 cluster bacterium]
MKFKIFYHNIFQKHIVPQGHPEKPERITSINNLIFNKFSSFIHEIEKRETFKHISKIHSGNYLETIYSLKPINGLIQLDEDTFFSENTLEAAEYAVSGLLHSIDFVMKEKNNRSFVCSRPPGHHAEPDKAMGFCIFSNAAIGAKYALDEYKLKKVAVLDFDVHHGNGTQSFFEKDQKNLIFASSHEMPLFPGT